MMAEAPTPRRRVLLMASCLADAAPSISLAVIAAARLRASLEGVLAQDPRAEGAALVMTGAGAGAPLSPERLARAYAADARAFRRRLDQAAAAAALPWAFRTDTGALTDLALHPPRPDDAVLIAHRRLMALRGPVVLMGGAEGDQGNELAIDLAIDMARALGLQSRLLPGDTALAEIELLSASLILLPRGMNTPAPRLRQIIEAARCPVLLNAP